MFTLSRFTYPSVFLFREWGGDAPYPSVDKTEKPTELNGAQQEILKRVQEVMKHPEAQKAVNDTFKDLIKAIQQNPQMVDRFLTAIESAKQAKLQEVEKGFNAGKISGPDAIQESKKIINKYTAVLTKTFSGSITPLDTKTA